jgi:CheY-like chemotaxis protein
MPKWNGFEAARRLRNDFPNSPDTQIVALAGLGQKLDRERKLATSFDDHLTKPTNWTDLHAILLAATRLLE